MSLSGLLPLLGERPAFQRLREDLAGPGPHQFPVPDAARALLLSALWRALGRPFLVLTPHPEGARRLAEDLAFFCGDGAPVLLFPENEALPFERLAVDEPTVHGRLHVLAALLQPGDGRQPPLVVCSAGGLAQRTLAREAFAAACHTLQQGQRVEVGSLLRRWQALGYALEPTVEVPGTASLRGGILDIFPPGDSLPVRIELLGNTVESIRRFDPSTQRSVESVEQVHILPAREVLPSLSDGGKADALLAALSPEGCNQESLERIQQEMTLLLAGGNLGEAGFYAGFFNVGCLLDYLSQDSLVVVDGLRPVEDAGQELAERAEGLRRAKEGRGELPSGFPSPIWPWSALRERLNSYPRRLLLEWQEGAEGGLECARAPAFWGHLEALAASVARQSAEGGRLLVVSHHAARLQEILRDHDVGARMLPSLEEPPPPGSVTVIPGSLPGGFVLPLREGPLVLLTDAEVFGSAKQRRSIRRHVFRREVSPAELTPGSYVIHVEHGIGRFGGTTTVAGEQGQREYLVLEYAQGDKLFVPMEHLDRISPYYAPVDAPPTLTRLGTQEWARVRQRVKESVQAMAEELLGLYASREVAQGHPFPPDTPWQRELEDSFPYQETPDQLLAIQDVKEDMGRPRPMDRLVCGDVGYGKTEIALRAAFKAVQDGKQGAVLVPTTLLAQQHYVTFSERLSPFPVRVEVLSRFRPPEEQRQVVQGLKEGTVDIVIGTHRLLQKDVGFKDLGLVVVDDEQRFGVADKERLKKLRREVDVLTMSATPIPRTLHMALSGIRDMSTIQTPPEARQPVKTYVSEYSDDLVREAILRELDRGGQVFFVHNRVRDLPRWAAQVQSLVPEALVGMAHGRMDEEELASVMTDFTAGRLNVLVCTTIIEAGLDLPSVNTLLVHRPELLGLSQMYQLRGRVGRGAHRAYAYFLVPPGRRITEAAQKRLKAILEAEELGAGFRIAMKDLEIRGAGNLLGSQQSGHIQAVGFDLYCRLLQEAVEEARARAGAEGEEQEAAPPALPPAVSSVSVDLPLSAFISEGYISHLPTRLGVYQRLVRVATLEEVEALGQELRDRFGPLPEEVQHLLVVVRLRFLAAAAGVEAIVAEGRQVVLRLREPVGGARLALQRQLDPVARVGQSQVRLDMRGRWQVALAWVLESMAAFRERVLALAAPGG